MGGNRKLFWKEVFKLSGGKVECCSNVERLDLEVV